MVELKKKNVSRDDGSRVRMVFYRVGWGAHVGSFFLGLVFWLVRFVLGR